MRRAAAEDLVPGGDRGQMEKDEMLSVASGCLEAIMSSHVHRLQERTLPSHHTPVFACQQKLWLGCISCRAGVGAGDVSVGHL
eukprot:scaffold21884_cov21-Tisochrysis_lutea.AAC.1